MHHQVIQQDPSCGDDHGQHQHDIRDFAPARFQIVHIDKLLSQGRKKGLAKGERAQDADMQRSF